MVNRDSKIVRKRLIGKDNSVTEDTGGVAAVEFAMLIFPLTAFLLAIINFGYALFGINQMQAIANEAVRAVSYAQMTDTEAETFLAANLKRYGGDDLTVNVDSSAANVIVVEVTGNSENLTLADFPFASFSHYQPEFNISSVTPKLKFSSVGRS
ncbi:MAG: TadE/TadG family type IV pilus assembly protein [Pseudomonadota bacterium]